MSHTPNPHANPCDWSQLVEDKATQRWKWAEGAALYSADVTTIVVADYASTLGWHTSNLERVAEREANFLEAESLYEKQRTHEPEGRHTNVAYLATLAMLGDYTNDLIDTQHKAARSAEQVALKRNRALDYVSADLLDTATTLLNEGTWNVQQETEHERVARIIEMARLAIGEVAP